jgi:D-alanyl-lipoteichoic acid acyltransferase DltB (MBOAT superfamily)
MTIVQILILAGAALVIGWLFPSRFRPALILAGSLLAVYWLQPSTPIRNLDFWLPTASIGLAVIVWYIAAPSPAKTETTQGTLDGGEKRASRRISFGAAVVLGVIFAVGLSRYLSPLCCLTRSRPPELLQIALVVGSGIAIAALIARTRSRFSLAFGAILVLLGLFLVLKASPLTVQASVGMRILSGQSPALAASIDLPWLGFSYLAFRLIHVLRDFQAGKLTGSKTPAFTLSEFVSYTLFFPALIAGPIDRSQHFIGELRQVENCLDGTSLRQRLFSGETLDRLAAGGKRIFLGIFKKFVLADSLALFALNPQNAGEIESTFWMWVLLYAYTLRIYFDFSGYTDLAIGMGYWLGVRLPENFDRPYQRENLTSFWNSWHITLAQWFRAYFFNPVTRFLRSGGAALPAWVIILLGQLGTMVLIGLWHGISVNFAAWGAWHGLGLFVHNRWSGWMKSYTANLHSGSGLHTALRFSSWFLTFHWVALGWVWFALPAPETALSVFRLLGGAR